MWGGVRRFFYWVGAVWCVTVVVGIFCLIVLGLLATLNGGDI